MSVKKAKGKDKGKAKKSAKKSAPNTKTKKGKDIVQVRENINELVKASAKTIANKVIEVAKTGQLASARYLFEAVGLYPATEETKAKPQGDSLAHTLLKRMGLPTEPVICEEEPEPVAATSDAKAPARETAGTAEEYLEGEREEEHAAVPTDSEE